MDVCGRAVPKTCGRAKLEARDRETREEAESEACKREDTESEARDRTTREEAESIGPEPDRLLVEDGNKLRLAPDWC